MSSGPGPLPGSSQHSPHRPRSVGARDRVLPGLRGLESEPALASAVSHAGQVTPRASGSPASPGFLSWEMGQHHHQPNEGNKLHEAVSPAPGAAEGGARVPVFFSPSPSPILRGGGLGSLSSTSKPWTPVLAMRTAFCFCFFIKLHWRSLIQALALLTCPCGSDGPLHQSLPPSSGQQPPQLTLPLPRLRRLGATG